MSYFTKSGRYSPKLSELERQNRKEGITSPKPKKSADEVLRAIKRDLQILATNPSQLSYLPSYCL